MPEMPHIGRHKSDPILVAAVNGILVAQTASWVRNGSHTSLARLLHRVVPGEWEESIARQHRSLHPQNFTPTSSTSTGQASNHHSQPAACRDTLGAPH